jgi:hypothetical protein
VLRLANDQVLVAGGTDQGDNPVSALEWFAADGASCAACPEVNTSLPARPDLAVVALPAGGALAAGATPSADAIDVWWITPEGTAQALEPIVRTRHDVRVRLVSASDGAPWAWTGTTWLQFDPWQARFLPVTDAPLDGPAEDAPAPVAVDPGLFVWVAQSPSAMSVVRGFRHGVRGRLTRDAAPLLLLDASHVAPDRPPRSGVVSFSKDGLLLAKPFTLPAPRSVVADTLYGDFDLSAKRDITRALPDVEIGGVAVGAGACSWPTGAKDALFAIHRRGATLNIEVGDARTTCRGPDGRVGIALRAPQFGETLVRQVVISR